MILIAHRGNINGNNPEQENNPKYVLEAMGLGYDVEIDVWGVSGTLFLGHNCPQYKISIEFLITNKNCLWCHAKNKEAFQILLGAQLNCFWHTTEDYVLTSNKHIWVYPGKDLMTQSIAVLPELCSYKYQDISKCMGICSNFIEKYEEIRSSI